jgi:hypothetical protein
MFRRFWPRMIEYQTSLADLADRIAQLEDALRISHARHSTEPHPLLNEAGIRVKEPFLRQARETLDSRESSAAGHRASSPKTDDGTDVDIDNLSVSLDTFSVSEFGRSKYIGPGGWLSVSTIHD